MPEPPVDIQVEPGPQDGTLLVTWQPATPTSSTNGALVTGYAVYADGKKVTDVDSPTGSNNFQFLGYIILNEILIYFINKLSL